MAVRRPGLGHELTVGAHCLKAASVVAAEHADGALGRSRAAVGDLRVVQVAALAHDVGKLEGGAGHAERGAPPAARAALRSALARAAAADVADLVRLHLTLIETALRVDLDDEDAILRCAATVGRLELLAPLHLLTAADSIATGPATWTPWTAALVGTLVARLDAALSPTVDGAGLVERAEKVRAATIAALPEDSTRRRSSSSTPRTCAISHRASRRTSPATPGSSPSLPPRLPRMPRSSQSPRGRSPVHTRSRWLPPTDRNCSRDSPARWRSPDSISSRSTPTAPRTASRSTCSW